MSQLTFKDTFNDLRNWTGSGVLDDINFFVQPSAVQAGVLTSKRTFFDAERISIRFFDTLNDLYLSLSLAGREIIRFDASTSNYMVVEGDLITTGPARTGGVWHLLEIDISSSYTITMDGTTIGKSSLPARQAFDVTIAGAIWDEMVISRSYNDDYQGGTGTANDLLVNSLTIESDGSLSYDVDPGYFYSDNIEYYYYANMGLYEFTANPSGIVIGTSGLPYIPGQPYFIVSDDDVSVESGFIRTPFDRSYVVSWSPNSNSDDTFIPYISGAFDGLLTYETALSRVVNTAVPIESAKLVLSNDGGVAAALRSSSSYIDHVKLGNAYQAFAEVTDKYGGPVVGVTVSWKTIDINNVVTTAGSSITDDSGIATVTFAVTQDTSFHVYAQVNPASVPAWIQVQSPIARVTSSVFQLDNSGVILDSQEARAAIGENIWGDLWNTNPGEATGLSFPNPTTRGQWETLHPELQRPPATGNFAASEPSGFWSGVDFNSVYPGIVSAVGTVETFMDPMFVARNGFWGQELISGADIRSGSPTIPSGQVLNPMISYEISRDSGVTIGSYNTVRTAVGVYDSVFYVFYQPGSQYSGSSVSPAGNFYFRGVAVYDSTLSQAEGRIEDIMSTSKLKA